MTCWPGCECVVLSPAEVRPLIVCCRSSETMLSLQVREESEGEKEVEQKDCVNMLVVPHCGGVHGGV